VWGKKQERGGKKKGQKEGVGRKTEEDISAINSYDYTTAEVLI